MSFKNKVVLVTGGSRGIGASIAKKFAEQDANVAIVGRNDANLKKIGQLCGSKAFIIKADLSNIDEVKSVIVSTIERFGQLDVLVNNAGIIKAGELLKGTASITYDVIMSTNLRAVVYLTELAAPHLVKAKGNVINISSTLGTQLVARRHDFTCYGMSKAALIYFTRGAAVEMGPRGVRVNSISPGPTKTSIFDTAGIPCDWDEWGKASLLGRSSDAEEVADLVLYLASDKAKSITGSNFPINNGMGL